MGNVEACFLRMRTLLSDLWPFITGRTGHPLYRRELVRWSRLSVWRRSVWILSLIAIGVPVLLLGVPMAMVLRYWLFPAYPFSSIALASVTTLLIGQEIARQLSCLSAAALTGAAMSADETQADDLLRLTPLLSRPIVLAKLGAALRPILVWPIVATTTRLLLFLATSPGWADALFELRQSMNPAWFPFLATMPPAIGQAIFKPAFWGYGLWQTFAQQIDAVRMTGIGSLWLAYYLLQPLLDFFLFTSLGLFAASKAHTRAAGLSAALGLGAATWILGYLGERVLSVLITLLWPTERPFGLFVTPPLWMVGMPAMDGGFIVIGGPFETMFVLIIIVKASLLLWLFRTTNQQFSLTSQR